MKDIYTPKKVPRIEVREKLHGHTQILLRNERTGRVERIEHDNTFTDGIEKYIQPMGSMGSPFFGQDSVMNRSYWKTLLGGIVLFDTALPVNPDAKYMPQGTSMTAHGSYGFATLPTDTSLGLYNTQESVEGDNSISFVYDWGTSYGNGEIASVALTTQDGGYIGYGNPSNNAQSSRRSVTENQYLGLIDATMPAFISWLYSQNRIYTVTNWNISSGTTSVTVYHRHLSVTEFDVFENRKDVNPTDFDGEITFTIPALTSGYVCVPAGASMPTSFMLIPYDSVSSGNSFTIYFLDVSNGNVTSKTITNNTGGTMYASEGLLLYIINSTYAIVYVQKNSTYTWYKININTSESLGEASNGSSVTINHRRTQGSNGWFTDGLMVVNTAGNGLGSYLYDPTLNRFLQTNGLLVTPDDYTGGSSGRFYAYEYIPEIDALKCVFQNKQSYYTNAYPQFGMCRNPLRLMTINNLDSSVTKTPDKTMKVTYTITRA